MRRPRLLLSAAVAVTVAAVPAASALPTSTAAADRVLGRYVLKLADGVEPASLASTLPRLGVTAAVAFETVDALAVTAPRSAVNALLREGVATSARPERKIELHLAESVGYIGADQKTLSKPGVASVRGTRMARPAVDGTGSTVAVLDTGIFDLHPDLVDRVVAHRNFELSYVADLLLTSEQLDLHAAATGELARTDDIGHGTHVAGIVAGTGFAAQHRKNDNRGVAPGAKLVDLRIAAGPVQGLVDDMGWERNAIAAFDWLVRHHEDRAYGLRGIQLSTNSWGLTGTDVVYGAPSCDPLREIIEVMHEEGIHTVFSAGNDGRADRVSDTTVPNGLPEVISVAASCKPGAIQEDCAKPDNVNDIATFSSRGPSVDIAAPGVEIVSAVSANIVGALAKACAPAELGPVPCEFYRGQYGGPDATQADVVANYALYGSLHGTSMAGPHIAGVVALLLQANPNLTPDEMQAVIAGTAKDRQKKGRDIEAGWGLVNVPSALAAATRLKTQPMSRVLPGFRWASSL